MIDPKRFAPPTISDLARQIEDLDAEGIDAPRCRSRELLPGPEARALAGLEAMSDGFFTLDRELRLTYANAASARLTGFTVADSLGKTIEEVHPDWAGTQAADALGRVLRDNVSAEYEIVHGEVTFAARAYPSETGLSVYFTDATEVKRGDEERRRLVESLHAIEVGLHVWEIDDPDDPAGMRLVYSNPAASVATGSPTTGLLGRTLREAFPAADPSGIPASLAAIAAGGVSRSFGDFGYEGVRVSERVFSMRAFPLTHRRVGVAFNDVTEMRSSEARLAATVESLSDAFYRTDLGGRITYVNAAAVAFLGRPREKLLTMTLDDLDDQAGLPFRAIRRRAVGEMRPVDIEVHHRASDRWLDIRCNPSAEGLTIITRDSTERKAMETRLVQAQKLESIGLLASAIAHDFNNLLMVITGYGALIEAEKAELSPLAVQGLEAIRTSAARGTALTRKLLVFSRTQTEFTSVADVSQVVTSALDLVGSLLGENITVERRLNPAVGTVALDVTHLEQVIVNLVVNARDAVQGTGTIVVETRTASLAEGAVAGLAPGSYAVIVVGDNGCGMDDATMARIFDPFFTTKAATQGTGLGLSSSYDTIAKSRGHIGVASRPGVGTTFTIYIPCSDRPITSRVVAAPLTRESAAIRKVLVVDDDATVRGVVARMLPSDGYSVTVASGAGEARERLAVERFDLMITDAVMPGEDGFVLAKAAVSAQPDLPILFISGYAPSSLSGFELAGRATAFLQKPFTVVQLTRSVDELLARAQSRISSAPALLGTRS